MAIGRLNLASTRADHRNALAQFLARQVAHVETEHVGAGLEQLFDHLGIFGSGPQGGQDLRSPSAFHLIAPLGDWFL